MAATRRFAKSLPSLGIVIRTQRASSSSPPTRKWRINNRLRRIRFGSAPSRIHMFGTPRYSFLPNLCLSNSRLDGNTSQENCNAILPAHARVLPTRRFRLPGRSLRRPWKMARVTHTREHRPAGSVLANDHGFRRLQGFHPLLPSDATPRPHMLGLAGEQCAALVAKCLKFRMFPMLEFADRRSPAAIHGN